jgi:Protein of unknown function (DUF2934)
MRRAKSPRNGNAGSRSGPALSIPTNSDVVTAASVDLESEIRRRAYELYEQRGCPEGTEKEDWLAAEREILARHNNQHGA